MGGKFRPHLLRTQWSDFDPFPLSDEKDGKETSELEEEKKENPYSLGNICWFMAAIAVFYHLEFPTTCLYDPRVQRLVLFCFVFCLRIFVQRDSSTGAFRLRACLTELRAKTQT